MLERTLRDAGPGDAAAVAAIYNREVLGGTATFEVDPVDAAEMARRIGEVQTRGLPWLVACDGDEVVGYAYAGPWKPRAAYARTVETSVYVGAAAQGRGIGKALYVALVERLRAAGVHALIAGIALPNPPSIRLHEALGFEAIGHFRDVGFKLGRWVDVGYWELLLPVAGPH
jgi:phosphinothricin acetyltransferase